MPSKTAKRMQTHARAQPRAGGGGERNSAGQQDAPLPNRMESAFGLIFKKNIKKKTTTYDITMCGEPAERGRGKSVFSLCHAVFNMFLIRPSHAKRGLCSAGFIH